MESYTCQEGDVVIGTDPELLDLDFIHDFLANESYWARGISREEVETAIENSLNFGLYRDGQQLAFLRVITDYATFAYISDVFVAAAYRGQGLAQALLRCALRHPQLQGLRKWTLDTRDAQSLYYRFGFRVPPAPGKYMVYRVPDER
ncbi:MAG: GNAT family N-acetyltransferase [Anaerolineae bacterium]|nr:GNAT family N-acetyltransferase [Anaerolineae bacterium]